MLSSKVIVALDAMGGDYAPASIIQGADLVLSEYKASNANIQVEFLIYGQRDLLAPLIDSFPVLKAHSRLIHCESVVGSNDKPSLALRSSKNTSMGMAIDAVKQREADAVVSAGNTGALMAISKVYLRTLPGIDRPAIIGLFPTIDGKVAMLDLGANAECQSDNLVQFAIMGDAFAKVLLNIANPKVGLLNIGSEDIKGNEVVKGAWSVLTNQIGINFTGYVEADDIPLGKVDVVVADGFTGNVAIKMAEGVGYLSRKLLEKSFKSSLMAKLGYLLAKRALKQTFSAIDGRNYNGAMLVGLNGIVVKSHGGADKIAFANAIKVAIELRLKDINQKIIQEVKHLQHTIKINSAL
jgi:phosphate acyltransferase